MNASRRVAAFAIGTWLIAGCAGAAPPVTHTPDTSAQLLRATWSGYKHAFIQNDGRVIDWERNGDSTSEGQAYAMLRSAWMNDRATFDQTYHWAQQNLFDTHTGLFDYLWGADQSGRYHALSTDNAADADEDIAFALLLADKQWPGAGYAQKSQQVMDAIWNIDVVAWNGSFVLVAGDWARNFRGTLVFNPSYFAPYAYRAFAHAQPQHQWMAVVDSGYRLLTACSSANLSESSTSGLPPNWCAVGPAPSQVAGVTSMTGGDEYGYDAFRVMWRVALDAKWNGDARASAYLQSQKFLRDQWHSHGHLASRYSHDGHPLSDEDIAAYGGDIGAFVTTDASDAKAVLTGKLIPSAHAATVGKLFGDPRNYYQQNWAWFGFALVAGNLTPA